MRAAIVKRFGASDVIVVSEIPDRIPEPGEVPIDVTHAAVGLVDVFIRQGLVSAGLVNLHTNILPLEEAPEAHRQIETGRVNGRILLAP